MRSASGPGSSTATSPSWRRCVPPACRCRSPRTSTRSAALTALDWSDRTTIHAGYAATLVKKQAQRPTFDALFDIYFPRLVGAGVSTGATAEDDDAGGVRDNAEALADFREALRRPSSRATSSGWPSWPPRWSAGSARCRAAVRACRRGRRTPPCSGWRPSELVDRIVQALLAEGRTEEEAQRSAGRRIGGVHPDGRGRRPPPDRRGEGARARRQRGDPAEHRPPRLHLRAEGRPRGDAPRDLPARAPAGHPADPGAPRQAPRPARLPAYRPGLDVHRRRPARPPTTSRSGRTAPSWWCCATSAARWPTSRSSRCCWSSRCATSSRRCAPSPSSTTCTRSPTTSGPAPTSPT